MYGVVEDLVTCHEVVPKTARFINSTPATAKVSEIGAKHEDGNDDDSETDGFKATLESLVYVENDFNDDGSFNVADILYLLCAMADGKEIVNADLNGDGALTLVDVLRVMKLIAQ